MQSVLTVIAAFIASAYGTRAFIGWLTARRLVAVENERTMHTGSIPQGGGVPVVGAIVGVTLLMWPWSWMMTLTLAATAGLAVLSAINDVEEVPPKVRLAAHAAAAALVIAAVLGWAPVLGGFLPLVIERLLVLAALVWFINLYNFMDGIDGITGVETLTIAGGALLVLHAGGATSLPGPSPLDGLALAIAGAACGFLVWNWHRARIFLGDVGSIPLGLLTGAVLLHLAATLSLTAAVILPLYYLTDATLTLLNRLVRGEKIWQAHRKHAYQRAALALGSHSAVVLRIAACNAVLVGASVLAIPAPVWGLAVAFAAVATLMWHLETAAASGPAAADQRPGLADPVP